MKSYDSFYRRKKIITFSLAFLATAIIAAFLLASAWHKDETIVVDKNNLGLSVSKNNMVSSALFLLKNRLYNLQQSDKEYAGVLLTSNNKTQLDNINKKIVEQENIFRSSIDSIFLQATTMPTEESDPLVKEIVVGYRSILENRSTVSSLRNASLAGTKDLKPGDMALFNAENMIRERENRIAELESELKNAAMMSKSSHTENPETASRKLKSLNENIAKQANDMLTLTGENSRLQQENDKLLKQKNDLTRNGTATETGLRQRIAALEQDIRQTNADVRLAQVDCNLNRVDAGKIIYTSKQRKELLAEASGILTSLSEADDADTRKKAQDKINRLNKIVASSRD